LKRQVCERLRPEPRLPGQNGVAQRIQVAHDLPHLSDAARRRASLNESAEDRESLDLFGAAVHANKFFHLAHAFSCSIRARRW
jgi:hypothetical protein